MHGVRARFDVDVSGRFAVDTACVSVIVVKKVYCFVASRMWQKDRRFRRHETSRPSEMSGYCMEGVCRHASSSLFVSVSIVSMSWQRNSSVL